MKNWKKDINQQIESHCKAYGLKPLPYIKSPEVTFDDILESQVGTTELDQIVKYIN